MNPGLLADALDMVALPPSARTMLAVVLALYVLVLIGVSFYSTEQVANEEDYLVAGRRLPLFLTWGSLIATWFGAASMTGAAQAARDSGLRGTVLDPWSCSFTLIIAGVFYAKPLWRMKLLTMGDFFRVKYGPRAEAVACTIQVPSYFGWIAGQFLALGAVQEAYFGIPHIPAVLIATGVTLLITMSGGMWSVTLTDTLQIVVAFIGLLFLGHASMTYLSTMYGGSGGWLDGISQFLSHTPPDHLTLMPEPGTAALLAWTGTWATGLFGNIPGQDLQQRVFSAKSERVAAQACVISGVTYLAFGLIPVLLGLTSNLTHPEPTSVRILMLMAGSYLSPIMAVVFVVSFVSIVVSTATGAVLAPATILGHNLLGRLQVFKNHHLALDRICVFFIAMGGLALAFSGESTLGLLDLSLSIALVALFVPLTMGLFGRPRSEWSAILACLLGIGCFFPRYLPERFVMRLPAELSRHGTEAQHFTALRRKMSADRLADAELIARLELAARSGDLPHAAADLAPLNAADALPRDPEQVRKIRDIAHAAALSDTRNRLKSYMPLEEADAAADAVFQDGMAYEDYIALKYPPEQVGVTMNRALYWYTVGSADLYGLAASFAGYFLGQALGRRPKVGNNSPTEAAMV